ncbi:MAG: DUF4249 family protein [Chitinophagales bacterium]
MRLYYLSFLYVLAISPFASCDNAVEINGEYQEKVLVYGLLDHAKDTNYLRIEKSFLNDQINALVLSQDPAQLYYSDSDLQVSIEEWKSGLLQRTLPAERVNGDTLGIPKANGIFASAPNILYRLIAQLDSSATYTLQIIHEADGDTIRSTTQLVYGAQAYYPTKPDVYLDFTDTTKITYYINEADNGRMYELWMHFFYYEKELASGDSVLKHADWQIFANKISENSDGIGFITYSLNRNNFFTFLAGSIDPDPNVSRRFAYLDFTWYIGSEEIYSMYLNTLANLGINENYISPEYTNVEGGMGLFASRLAMPVHHVLLYDETIDSIACGSITGNLRFYSSQTNPGYPGCSL